MNKSIIFSLLSLLILIGTPANGAFRKIPVSRTEPCFFRLTRIESISQRCVRWVDKTAKLPFWQGSLGFQLGRLSYARWQKLTKLYGAWHNVSLLAPYSPQRNYELLDFMPPTLQAWDRHRFYAQEQTLSGQDFGGVRSPLTKIQLVTNCWGTLYEALRLAHEPQVQSPVLFVTAAQPMLETLRQISIAVEGEQPGDIVLILHRHGDREYLDHAALVIDRNLFFEKAGTGDEVPYRFVESQTLQQIWNPAIFHYELRRPLKQQRLPSPRDRFSLNQNPVLGLPMLLGERWRSYLTVVEDGEAPPTFFGMQSLPPLQRVQGRFQLPSAVYQPQLLWPSRSWLSGYLGRI
jgi:hypothetical protein